MKNRLLRYTVNKIAKDQEDLRINNLLIGIWDLWVKLIRDYKLNKFLKQNIKRITRLKLLIQRNKIMYWRKINNKLSKKH